MSVRQRIDMHTVKDTKKPTVSDCITRKQVAANNHLRDELAGKGRPMTELLIHEHLSVTPIGISSISNM